jgi:hypothetical protein
MRDVLLFIVVALACGLAGPLRAQDTTTPTNAEIEARRRDIRAAADTLRSPERTTDERQTPPGWKPSRNSWGQADLSGVYTNNDERSIPFERPAEFDGRRLQDITPQELAALQNARREANIEIVAASAPRDPGTFGWFEAWNARNSRAWLVVDPPDGHLPALTPEGQRRASAQAEAQAHGLLSYEDRNLYTRCISRGVPGSMLPAFYGNAYEIHQTRDWIAVRYEQIHETRLIPLDGRPPLARTIRSYMGDARGHWERDTLVVDTRNIRDDIAYRGSNGGSLHLTERFTPIGPSTLEWTVTVDDPATWVRPWTFAMNLKRVSQSQQPFEYACHEGNYSLPNILRAERLQEPRMQNAR